LRDLPSSFALKPNRGLGGAGIIIAYGESKRHQNQQHPFPFWRSIQMGRVWIGPHKTRLTQENLRNHVFNILDGRFSLSRASDSAYFEERIQLLKDFRAYSSQGIPDIRVIVFNGVPVMAELRIPTIESEGKANLHLGGVGAGIDLGTGTTTYAVHHDNPIVYHPDNTRLSLRGIAIPAWEEVLDLAVRAQNAVGAPFLGVDISIDKERGPVVLELNARPGLAIQIANRAPLRSRLDRVEGLEITSMEQGVRIAQSIFTQKIVDSPKRKILGMREKILLLAPSGSQEETIAKIDTGAYRTAICTTLAQRLHLQNIITYKTVQGALGKQRRPVVALTLRLGGKTIHTEVFVVDRTELKHEVIVGRRDLNGFLVDPSKNERQPTP
jgi:alpha-L-glutamate ligase-like protein